MNIAEKIRDRLELVDGKVYWKRCELYRWLPCKIRAGKANHAGERYVVIDGYHYEESKIIGVLTTTPEEAE